MGEYLLSGWTMLSHHCDKCLVPKVKKGGIEKCINCDNE